METTRTRISKSLALNSLLARETNWMETEVVIGLHRIFIVLNSLLARETNWMETFNQFFLFCVTQIISLLARETNWMETCFTKFWKSSNEDIFLYSLEKIIEWKLLALVRLNFALSVFLYSLEKIIEWKLNTVLVAKPAIVNVLYSLEKLIEWKQDMF